MILMALNEVNIAVDAAVTPGNTGVGSSCDIRSRRSTNTSHFDTDYSRGTFSRFTSTVAGTWDFLDDTIEYDSVGSVWIHINSYDAAGLDCPHIEVVDSSGDIIFRAFIDNVSNNAVMRAYSYNDAQASETVAVSALPGALAARDFDFCFEVASDTVHFYMDGVLQGSFDLDLHRRSAATVMHHGVARSNSTSGSAGYTQVIITTDEPTIDWKVKDINPDGAGTHTDWTGAYTTINEIAYDDTTETTVVGAGTNSYTYDDVQAGIQTGYEITLVCVATVAAADGGATAPSVQNLVRTNATDYLLGSAVDVEGEDNRSAIVDYITENPDTSAQWTFSEINAAEFGFESS